MSKTMKLNMILPPFVNFYRNCEELAEFVRRDQVKKRPVAVARPNGRLAVNHWAAL
jgi:hypothetical protein